jgi:type I restriction enzyme S subunit
VTATSHKRKAGSASPPHPVVGERGHRVDRYPNSVRSVTPLSASDVWNEFRLADLGEIFTGRTPSTDNPGYFGTEFPFITPGDMHQGKYARDTQRGLSSDGAALLKRIQVPANSICVSCIGWQMGEVILTDRPSYTNQQINTIVPNEHADVSFLYYSLRPRKQELLALGATAGVRTPIMNKSLFSEMKVRLPSIIEQRRIAGILSAYDELIENNQLRIKILETMARNLYREWFVHFRFPGHEKVRRVASPLGEILEGWAWKKLADIADVNRAQINARGAPEHLHYIDISSVSPGQIESTTTYAFADAPGRARRIVQHGDLLWSCVRPNRRSYAQVMHPQQDTIASTGFAVLTATKVPFTYLYFATTTDDFVAYLTNNATGAAYPAVSAATFEQADMLLPSGSVLEKFGDTTIPIAEQINLLQSKIRNLRSTRDLLLPQLLAGKGIYREC